MQLPIIRVAIVVNRLHKCIATTLRMKEGYRLIDLLHRWVNVLNTMQQLSLK